MGMGGVAGMGVAGMDLTQAAYRYNQNMMEYYTCKTSKSAIHDVYRVYTAFNLLI